MNYLLLFIFFSILFADNEIEKFDEILKNLNQTETVLNDFLFSQNKQKFLTTSLKEIKNEEESNKKKIEKILEQNEKEKNIIKTVIVNEIDNQTDLFKQRLEERKKKKKKNLK